MFPDDAFQAICAAFFDVYRVHVKGSKCLQTSQRLPWEYRQDHSDMIHSLVQMTCSLDAKVDANSMDTDTVEAEDYEKHWPSLSKMKMVNPTLVRTPGN